MKRLRTSSVLASEEIPGTIPSMVTDDIITEIASVMDTSETQTAGLAFMVEDRTDITTDLAIRAILVGIRTTTITLRTTQHTTVRTRPGVILHMAMDFSNTATKLDCSSGTATAQHAVNADSRRSVSPEQDWHTAWHALAGGHCKR